MVQGSPLSPLLFDIYLEDMLIKLKNNFSKELYYKAYADDIVFIVEKENISDFLNQF